MLSPVSFEEVIVFMKMSIFYASQVCVKVIVTYKVGRKEVQDPRQRKVFAFQAEEDGWGG